MLSQAPNNTNNQPRRSQSARSVENHRHQYLNQDLVKPQTPHIHALIAAHRAMDRSRVSPAASSHRTNSNASQKRPKAPGHTPQPIQNRTSSHPPPDASINAQIAVETTPVPNEYTQEDHPYLYNITIPEDDSMVDNCVSGASSFRRVKKARSLTTPSSEPDGHSRKSHHRSFGQQHTLRTAKSSVALGNSRLRVRLKKSLNLLRPGSRMSPVSHPDVEQRCHAEAVHLARAQFLADPGEMQVSRTSSILFQRHRRNEQKAFRKSVRSSNMNDTDILEAEKNNSNDKALSKKRSFSISVRNRFMRAFGKSSEDKNDGVPPQHLEAKRAHFGSAMSGGGQTRELDSFDQKVSLPSSRQSIYISSTLADGTSITDHSDCLPDRPVSRGSLQSGSRSRVTSWTNSTTQASVSTRHTPHDYKRLSVIKEDAGPHQPSSSAGRHLGGISPFPEAGDVDDFNRRIFPHVDSQRLYSALMKRIREEEEETEHNAAENGGIHEPTSVLSATEPRPSIRRVSHETTTSINDQHAPENIFIGMNASSAGSNGISDATHETSSLDRNKLSPVAEEQSSFFPFTSHESPQTPSPFRKLLQERRNKTLDRNISTQSKVCEGQFTRRFPMSSESVYSRTSDGGTNADYISPVASNEDLQFGNRGNLVEAGIATIISSGNPHHIAEHAQSMPKIDSGTISGWKSWMEHQVKNFQRQGSKDISLFRENAQIGTCDPSVEPNNFGQVQFTDPAVSSVGTTISFPSVQRHRFPSMRDVPRNTTSTPKRSGSITSCQGAMIEPFNQERPSSVPVLVDEHRKSSIRLRKISPANIARILKERKSQIFMGRPEGADKENKSGKGNESPPMSTPGRLNLQFRNGNSTGKLRKRASEMTIKPSAINIQTPVSASAVNGCQRDQHDESPSDRVKKSLVARLSRPFNMDVPEENRPFDSMYLGKLDNSSTNILDQGRLSVAPQLNKRRPNGYGGLGPSPFQDQEKATALPKIPSPSISKSRVLERLTTKRMVSSFLRSRRTHQGLSADSDDDKVQDAAFL